MALPIKLAKKGQLPVEMHGQFVLDVLAGKSDAQLATDYGLRERTATNWRLRAQEYLQEKGHPDKDARTHDDREVS